MYGSTRVQWVCCYFLELVTNNCFYLCLLHATIPLCIVAEAQPRAGDILQLPPAAWPSRYKSGSRHSTVSQEPDQRQRRDRIAHPPKRVGGGPKMGVAKRPRGRAPPVAELGSLERPCTFLPRTRPRPIVIASRWPGGHSWREEDVTESHTSEVSLHGRCV